MTVAIASPAFPCSPTPVSYDLDFATYSTPHIKFYFRDVPGGHTFVLDSGAGDVSLPRSLGLAWLRDGSLKPYRMVNFHLANGAVSREQTYILPALTLKGITVENIEMSINQTETGLLGQGFLRHVCGWSINNSTNQLLLYP
jgi:hypothetical protein